MIFIIVDSLYVLHFQDEKQDIRICILICPYLCIVFVFCSLVCVLFVLFIIIAL